MRRAPGRSRWSRLLGRPDGGALDRRRRGAAGPLLRDAQPLADVDSIRPRQAIGTPGCRTRRIRTGGRLLPAYLRAAPGSRMRPDDPACAQATARRRPARTGPRFPPAPGAGSGAAPAATRRGRSGRAPGSGPPVGRSPLRLPSPGRSEPRSDPGRRCRTGSRGTAGRPRSAGRGPRRRSRRRETPGRSFVRRNRTYATGTSPRSRRCPACPAAVPPSPCRRRRGCRRSRPAARLPGTRSPGGACGQRLRPRAERRTWRRRPRPSAERPGRSRR